jgi:DNA polymerase-3 subunit epsilon
LNYAIIDIETTGGNSRTGKITEIAVFLHNGSKVVDVYETLVNPGMPIPPFVSKLTGISDDMVKDAPSFEEVASTLNAFTANAIFVAHNAHFDYGFVREEFRRVGVDFKRKKLCTVQLSRHAFPGLASYSLDKITAQLDIKLNGHHRAASDAEATAALFDRILEVHNGVGLFDMHIGMPSLEGITTPYIDEAFLNTIPDETGVIRFYDASDNLLYSKRSANVLTSICEKLKQNATADSQAMRKVLHRIDYQLTGSQLVAQLLEVEDVLSNQPEFNHGRFSMKAHNSAVLRTINGASHLVLEKLKSKEPDTMLVFSNFFEGRDHLNFLAEKWRKPIINLGSGKRSLPALELNEGMDVESGFSKLSGTVILVDEGRYANERTRILVKNGVVLGFGYYDNDFQFSNDPLDDLQVNFKYFPELEYVIRKFVEKGRFEKLIQL